MNTQLLNRISRADPDAIARGGEILRAGGLVVFPTETVYGLGADATNDAAVAAIFEAKGRPQFNPLIVHVSDKAQAAGLVEFSTLAERLADTFWPGALTLVLPRKSNSPVSLLASAGLDTIAVRMPSHPVAAALIKAAGRPVAAPSANVSGRISATAASHAVSELGSKVDLILDGGAAPLGIESTVVGFSGERPLLLRPGAVTREALAHLVGPLGSFGGETVRAPGQLASHYAPQARLRLDARSIAPGEALLAFGPDVPKTTLAVLNLSETGDLKEAAANLFAMLRRLDDTGADSIAVMPIPHTGLGEAINDRLQRAAAPR